MAAGLAWTSSGLAAACRVEIAGGVSDEWQQAARSLSAAGLPDTDCASIRFKAVGTGVRLIFTAPDGRVAERNLSEPDELPPTIEALRVTGPAPEQLSPQTSTPKPQPTSRANPNSPSAAARDTPQPEKPPAASRRGPILALQGGIRGGTAGLFSPVLAGSIALGLERWELAARMAAEVQYFDLKRSTAPGGRTSGVALTAAFGRRQPLSRLALVAGGQLSFALLFPGDSDGPADEPVDDRVTEWRLGAYLGCVVPRSTGPRFRAEVNGGLVLSSYPDHEPITPGRYAGALLGVEFGGS